MTKYTDLNIFYDPEVAGETALLTEVDNIKTSVLRLLSTPKGSVPFDRNYGCSLRELLFENSVTLNSIQVFLYNDITTFEPRVSILPSNISATKLDRNTYEVTCYFSIPSLNYTYTNLSTEITNG